MYTFFSGDRLQNGSPYAIGPLSVCPVCLPVTLVAQATLCLEGDPASPCQKGDTDPIFSPCLLWPKAWWIKMPLGTAVGLGSGDIVLDVDPVPPKRGTAVPNFSAHVYSGQTAGWIKMPFGTDVGFALTVATCATGAVYVYWA